MKTKILATSVLTTISSATIVFAPPFHLNLTGPSTGVLPSIPVLPIIAIPSAMAAAYLLSRRGRSR